MGTRTSQGLMQRVGGQRRPDVVGDVLGLGVGGVARDDLAVAPDEELGEVPLDPAAEQALLLALEPAEERVGVVAVDVDLGEHRERHAVVDLAELADLVLGARLLRAELVAREAEHDQALVVQVLVELPRARRTGG